MLNVASHDVLMLFCFTMATIYRSKLWMCGGSLIFLSFCLNGIQSKRISSKFSVPNSLAKRLDYEYSTMPENWLDNHLQSILDSGKDLSPLENHSRFLQMIRIQLLGEGEINS